MVPLIARTNGSSLSSTSGSNECPSPAYIRGEMWTVDRHAAAYLADKLQSRSRHPRQNIDFLLLFA